jgi:hypothetical protein
LKKISIYTHTLSLSPQNPRRSGPERCADVCSIFGFGKMLQMLQMPAASLGCAAPPLPDNRPSSSARLSPGGPAALVLHALPEGELSARRALGGMVGFGRLRTLHSPMPSHTTPRRSENYHGGLIRMVEMEGTRGLLHCRQPVIQFSRSIGYRRPGPGARVGPLGRKR